MATPVLNYTVPTSLTRFSGSVFPRPGVLVNRAWLYFNAPSLPIYKTFPVALKVLNPLAVDPCMVVVLPADRLMRSQAAGTLIWRSKWRPKRGQLWPRTR